MPAGQAPGPQITHGTRIVLDPATPLTAVPEATRSLDLPLTPNDRFAMEYALTELLFNALRATADRDAGHPVVAEILDDGDNIHVRIEDGAGGFDLTDLPYDFMAPNERVDVNSESFERFQERHGGRRFGLGLLTTRSMVRGFSLAFVDSAGREAVWKGPGSVHGTRVRFHLPRSRQAQDLRRVPRRRVTGSATTADGIRARVRDLSLSGARLVFMSVPVPRMDEVYQMRLVLENHAALTVEAPARIVWVKRVGHCYDVGADFLPLDGHALTQLKWIIEQVEKSAGRDALGKIRVELLPPQARPQ